MPGALLFALSDVLKTCQWIYSLALQTIPVALKKRSYPQIANPKQAAENESNRSLKTSTPDWVFCLGIEAEKEPYIGT